MRIRLLLEISFINFKNQCMVNPIIKNIVTTIVTKAAFPKKIASNIESDVKVKGKVS